MAHFGYYVDLRGLQLSENAKWIQAMRVGEYQHPAYGKINFTLDRIMRFADSVKNKIRGIDLDIDYDHKTDPARGNEAAGWVKDAKVEGDSLYLLVDWTKTALQKIQEGAYRYFSPEFQDDWTDASGKKHQDVLFGGGITNRPFLKDLLPVNLSELTFAEQQNKKEGQGMDLAKLRKLYGLPEDGSQDDKIVERAEADRNVATNKLGTPPDSTATTHAPNQPATTNPQGTVNGLPFDATTATAVDDKGNMITPEEVQLNELAKTNPGLAIMLREQMKSNKLLAEQVQKLETANKLSGISVKLNEYRTGQTVVAPAVLDGAAKLLAKAPTQLHEDIHNVLKLVQGGKATVQLGEVGSSNNVSTTVNGQTATQEAEEKIAVTRKQFSEASGGKELSYADAMTDVFSNDHDLYARYQAESYAFKI
jgi:phage I-like protein